MLRLESRTDSSTIASLCASAGVPYTTGCGYYCLSKVEKISGGKDMVAVHEISNELIMGGKAVREKFGLGLGDISIGPDSFKTTGWFIFIQSTSSNRKIPNGVSIMVQGAHSGIIESIPCPQSPSVSSGAVAVSSVAAVAVSSAAAVEPVPAKAPGKRPASSEAPSIPKQAKSSYPASVVPVGWFDAGDGVSVRDYGSSPAHRMAGFDLDWTLIRTKSGKTFAVSKEDWEIWSPEVQIKVCVFLVSVIASVVFVPMQLAVLIILILCRLFNYLFQNIMSTCYARQQAWWPSCIRL
jgi:hypothetical protein